MAHDVGHISDDELLRAADSELDARRMAAVQAHLASCWSCRSRLRQLEAAIDDFVALHRSGLDPLMPPPEGARALLGLRIRELESATTSNRRRRFGFWLRPGRSLALACSLLVLIILCGWLLGSIRTGSGWQSSSRLTARLVPDPHLTPGATLPLGKDQVCAPGVIESVRVVPEPVARHVFAAYGIRDPQPRAWELDYLITPALGGADDVRNLWPQPYHGGVWSAHVKDALEDHLYRLVCAGKLDLATAQRDISQDWIGAYKRYFRTEQPLPEHATFLKDRPWE